MPFASLRSRALHSTVRGTVLTILTFTALQATAIAQGPGAGLGREARVCADIDGVMPGNVVVRQPFPSVIREMLTYSPTFRSQCERVARAGHLRIVLRLDMRSQRTDVAARAAFTRSGAGELLARIDVHVSANYAPVVAHEFEHVLEQLDRWNLPRMSEAGREVHEVEPGIYETERADAVGSIVEREMFGRRRTTRLTTPKPVIAP